MLKTLLDGSELLLGETVSILEEEKINYIIMGGWSPFLLNSHPIQHPGTKDVDILFESGSTERTLEAVLEKFVRSDFIYSAKHHFQLLKGYEVSGIKFMYNVDLIHPIESKSSVEFVNHLDVPVSVSGFIPAVYSLKTISLPGGDVFFKKLNRRHKMSFNMPNGKLKEIEFSLLNEPGLIISKSKSFINPKRDRDAFDIYLAIAQCSNYPEMINIFLDLKKTYPQVYASVYEIYKIALYGTSNSKRNLFFDNVLYYINKSGYPMSSSEAVLMVIEKFFVDIRFDE